MPRNTVDIKMLNRKQFNKALSAYRKKITEDKIPKFVKGVALKILRGVVLRTPVDTGFARNNWQVTVGSFGNDAPHGAVDDPDGTIEREASEIVNHENLSQIVYIWNAVPYIQYLEAGHSGKAPDGMLQITLAEIASELNSKYNFVGYYEART